MPTLGNSGGKDRVQRETTEPKHAPDTMPGLLVTGGLGITQALDALADATGLREGRWVTSVPQLTATKC